MRSSNRILVVTFASCLVLCLTEAVNVQIFGTQKSQATKKALRFFKERGINPHFVDLQQREIAPGELRRFADRFGLDALLDKEGKAYREAGLEFLSLAGVQLTYRLIADPALMVQPLVRSGNTLGVGWDETLWRDWYDAQKTGA